MLESQLAEGSFDLIHDKGTLDAILLSCSGPEAQASVAVCPAPLSRTFPILFY